MKKYKKVIKTIRIFKVTIIIILIFISGLIQPHISCAKEENKDVLNSQMESIDIQKFIQESQKYTSNVFKDTDMQELLNSAIILNY